MGINQSNELPPGYVQQRNRSILEFHLPCLPHGHNLSLTWAVTARCLPVRLVLPACVICQRDSLPLGHVQ